MSQEKTQIVRGRGVQYSETTAGRIYNAQAQAVAAQPLGNVAVNQSLEISADALLADIEALFVENEMLATNNTEN